MPQYISDELLALSQSGTSLEGFNTQISKIESVGQASKRKMANLDAIGKEYLAEKYREQQAREYATRYSVSDESLDSPIGVGINALAAGIGRGGHLMGAGLTSPSALANYLGTRDITPEGHAINDQILAKEKQRNKISETLNYSRTLKDVSPEQRDKWEQELGAQRDAIQLTPEEVAFRDTPRHPTNPYSVSKYQSLKEASYRKKNFMDPVSEGADAFGKLFVNQSDKIAAGKHGEEEWEKVSTTWNEGLEKIAKGDDAGGAYNLVSSFAQGAAGLGNVIVSNPAAVVTTIAESIPDMAGIVTSKFFSLSQAISGAERAKDKFVEKHDRLPEGEEVGKIIVGSLGVQALDRVGAKAVLGTLDPAELAAKMVKENAKSLSRRVAKSTLIEGSTEALQDIGEQLIEQKGGLSPSELQKNLADTNFGQTFTSAALGAGAGGGTTTVIEGASAKNEVASAKKAVEGAAKKVSAKAKRALDLRDTIASGDVSTVTDETQEEYRASDAVKALLATAPSKDSPVEDKETHLAKLNKHNEAKKEEIYALSAELQGLTPSSKEFKKTQNEMERKMLDLRDVSKSIEGYAQVIEDSKADIGAMVSNVSDDAVPTEKKKSAVSRLVRIMGSSPESVSLFQSEQIRDSGVLDEEQTKLVEEHIALRKTLEEVSGNISGKNEDERFKSISRHIQGITEATRLNDNKLTIKRLARLKQFKISHTARLENIKEGVELFNIADKTPEQVTQLKEVEDRLSSVNPETKKPILFGFTSGVQAKILPAVEAEVAAISLAYEQQKAHVETAFTKLTKAEENLEVPTAATTEIAEALGDTPVEIPLSEAPATTIEDPVSEAPASEVQGAEPKAEATPVPEEVVVEEEAKTEEPTTEDEVSGSELAASILEETKVEQKKDKPYSLAHSTLVGKASSVDITNKKTGEKVKGVSNIIGQSFKVSSKVKVAGANNFLQSIPNFFDSIKTDKAKLLRLNKVQTKAMATVSKFNERMSKHLIEDVLKLTNINFSDKNPMRTLFNEDANKGNPHGWVDSNVLSAMNMVLLNWMTSEAAGTINNYEETINKLLGKKPNDRVTPEEANLLQDVGIKEGVLAESLGNAVLKVLGVQPKKDTDGHVEANLAISIGENMISAGIHANLIQKTIISTKILNELGTSKEEISDLGFTSFIRVTTEMTQIDGTERQVESVSPEIEALTDTMKTSDNLLNHVFGLEVTEEFPGMAPPVDLTNKIEGTSQVAPNKIMDKVNKQQKQKNGIKGPMLAITQFLDKHQVMDMLGFVKDIEGTKHVTEYKSTQSTNNEISRYVNNFGKFSDQIRPEAAFYFAHKISKNMRIHMHGLINTQASKFHRHMIGVSDHAVKFDPKNKNYKSLEKQMYLAVAEALGVKTDKQRNKKSLEQVQEKLGGEVIQDGLGALTKILFESESIQPEQRLALQEQVLDAVAEGGEKTHSLDGLVAFATYQYNHGKGKPFEINISREVDGITNGVIISLYQLAAAPTMANLKEFLARGGWFTDSTSSYGEWNDKSGNWDIYQNLAKNWHEYLSDVKRVIISPSKASSNDGNFKKFNEYVGNATFRNSSRRAQMLDAVSDLVGGMDASGSLDIAIVRKLAKSALIPSNYGAGISKVIETFAQEVIDKLYSDMAKNKDNQPELDRLSAVIDTLTTSAKGGQVELNSDNALTAKLAKYQENQIIAVISNTYGAALRMAMEKEYGPLIRKRKKLNDAMILIFEGFNHRYLKETDKVLAAKRESTGREQVSLSKSEQAEILETLIDSQPIFKTFFSEGKKDGMLTMKSRRKTEYKNSAFATENPFSKPVPRKEMTAIEGAEGTYHKTKPERADSSSMRQFSSTTEYVDPGVSSMVLGVHAMDAAIIALIMERASVVGIHDAAMFSLDNAVEGSKAFNDAFLEVMQNYSLVDSIYEALDSAVKVLNKEAPEFIKEKNSEMAFAMAEAVEAERSTEGMYVSIKDQVTGLKGFKDNSAIARGKIDEDTTIVTQYNLEGGGTRVNEAPTVEGIKEAVAGAIEEMDTKVDEKLDPTSDSLGSSSSTFDPETSDTYTDVFDHSKFKANNSYNLDGTNTLTIYDELGKEADVEDSVEHDTHLKGVLTRIVNKVIEPITLYTKQDTEGYTDKNQGLYANDSLYMVHATPMRSLANGTKMSRKEVYVHEISHHVLQAGIDGNSRARKELSKLYLDIKPHMNWTNFLPDGVTEATADIYQIRDAKVDHDYIFGGGAKANVLHEFAVLVLTNHNFRQNIAKLDPKAITRRTSEKDGWLGKFSVWFQELMDWFFDQVTHTADQPTLGKLDILMEQLAGVDNRTKSMLEVVYSKGATITSKTLNTAVYGITVPVTMLLESGFVRKSRFSTIRNLGNTAELLPNINIDTYLETITDFTARTGVAEDGMVFSMLSEVKGRTRKNSYIHDLVRYRNKMIDQTRLKVSHDVGSHLLNSFLTALTKKDRIAITKGLLKTDIVTLVDAGNYTWNDIIDLLEDQSKVTDAINSTLTRLRQRPYISSSPGHYNWYANMSESLGTFMATGKGTEYGHRRNAHAIVHATNTGLAPLTAAQEKEIISIIDVLGTLHAISKTNITTHRKTLATLMRKEGVHKENGITFTLQVHKANKERTLKESFGGQAALMAKGYTQDIYSPNSSFVVAPATEEKELLRKGFKMHQTPISTDPNHPTPPTHFYTAKHGPMQTFNPGAMSNRNMNAQGTDLVSISAREGMPNPGLEGYIAAQDMNQYVDAATQDIINNKPGRGVKGTQLVPIVNRNSKITGYRYMMTEHNKDTLLQKNNYFEDVMGAMEASIIDKTNTEIVNKKVVGALYNDYLAEYEKNPSRYSFIGPTATNKYYRDAYLKLPKEAKDEIKKVWGSDGMYVKTEVAVTVFGQRKISVADLQLADEPNAVGVRVLRNMVNDVLYHTLNRPTAQRVERVWQEGVKLVKDAIVIKSGVVLSGNVAFNAVLLKVKGVSAPDIIKDHAVAFSAARDYQKDSREIDRLVREEALVPSKQRKRDIKNRINVLKHKIEINPVRELIELGVHGSIVEDIDMVQDKYSAKSYMEEYLDTHEFANKVAGKVPNAAKTAVKWATMQHDTPVYQFLLEATQLSDFASRYVLHKHNTTKGGMSTEESLSDIMEAFIQYDLPTHRYLQYMNDMGLWMFTKFFIRIQKVLLKTLQSNPGNVLASVLAHGAFDFIPSVTDPSVASANLLSRVNVNPIALMSNIVTAPLSASIVN